MKPNILFIIMDDQRADTLGAIYNPRIQTPNLDRIAAQGTVFTNTFITVPICPPGRAEVLTGCDSFTNKVMWFGIPIRPELKLMLEHMKMNADPVVEDLNCLEVKDVVISAYGT